MSGLRQGGPVSSSAGKRPKACAVKALETEDELRQKTLLEQQAWQEAYGSVNDPIPAAAFEHKAREEARNTLIAVSGGRVVGYACYRQCPDRDLIITGEIWDLYVLPAYRRRGIGRTLLQASMDNLDMYPRIAVWVPDENCGAAAFFSRFGFAYDGETDMKWVGRICDESRMLLERKRTGERHPFR